MTTYKNEQVEQIERLVNDTRAALEKERSKDQDKIDKITRQIEALEAELLPLPGQAKQLRLQGFVRQSKELIDQIEELNIKIARLQVEKAQLEYDRLAVLVGKFRAIVPEVVKLSSAGRLEIEQIRRQMEIDENKLAAYAQSINNLVWGYFGQPADEANRRLEAAQKRLNQAVNGAGVTTAA